MEIFLIFIIGASVGSFCSLCIYRIPMGESLIYPGSHCDYCKSRIEWLDLIPIVSYILLGGKCRRCNGKIPIKNVVIECIMGIIYMGLYVKYNITIEFYKYAAFTAILLIMSIIDMIEMKVYSKLTLFGILIAFIYIIIECYNGNSGFNYIVGAILGGSIILFIILISHGMGLGDVEVCFMCGLFLGTNMTFLMLVLSFLLGSILGGLFIALRIKSRKDSLPFIPFIAVSSIISIFFGNILVDTYIDIFL